MISFMHGSKATNVSLALYSDLEIYLNILFFLLFLLFHSFLLKLYILYF
jgi:hypothetical protein